MTQNNLGTRALGPGRAVGRSGGSAAAERGGGGLPPGPHRPHPRRPAPGLGHDPEQPGHSRSAALGERLGGPEGLRRLSEAVEAYRQALTVYTRDDLPQDWATTQNNLGARSGPGRAVGRTGGSAAAERGGGGLPPGPHRPHPRRPAPGLGHDPEQPGPRALGPGRAVGRSGGSAAAERGGGGLPPGPHRLHPRRPAPAMGHDPEQPGQRALGPGRAVRAVRRVCGG